MEKFLTFLSSGLFSNILAIISLLVALLPQKDTVSIDNSTNYYFSNNSSSGNKSSDQMGGVIALTGFLITYILYAFLQPYFHIILLILSFLVLINRLLKIAYKNQMIIPAMLVILATILNHFLPKEIINYWNHAYKIDFNQLGTLSRVAEQLSTPFREFIDLLFTMTTNPLSVAIIANMLFVFFATLSMFFDLFKPKRKIKVTRRSSVIAMMVFFAIIISFMFHTNPKSPTRIIFDKIDHFISN